VYNKIKIKIGVYYTEMENCIYCEKLYTKRGISRHRKKCKEIHDISNENIIMEKNKECYIIKLPGDCLRIIRDFLQYRDEFTTYARHYRFFMNISLLCKQFFPIFSLNGESMKNLSALETKEKISRKCANNNYGIDNNELDLIYHEGKKHRHRRDKDKIFIQVKIINAAYKKYGTFYNYQIQKKQREIDEKNRKELAEKEKKMRKEELIQKLREHNLPLREDSTLCYRYIYDNIGEINDVVNTMVEMDFFHKYTNYSNEYYNIQSNYIDFQRSMSFGDYYYLTSDDKKRISNMAKKSCLEKWCSTISSYDIAIKYPHLPITLHENVRRIMEKI
jgi:hypothetical protein